MKQFFKTPFLVGFFFVLTSTILFFVSGSNELRDRLGGFVIVNFALTIIYWVMYLFIRKSLDDKSLDIVKHLILTLFFISAHTLNRELHVFQDCSSWFLLTQVLGVSALLAVSFIDEFNRIMRWFVFILLTIGLLCWLYMALYVIPFYIVGTIGILLLGIGAHIFVPVLFFIRTLSMLKKHFDFRAYRIVFWSLSSSILIGLILFIIQWNLLSKQIGKTIREAQAISTDGLPGWFSVVKEYKDSWLFTDFVKMNIEYQVVDKDDFDFFGGLNTRNNLVKLHNPLIMVASLFSYDPLRQADKIQILKSIHGYEYLQELRLWTGKDIYTESVNTTVQLWPSNGIQYTEHTVQVTNRSQYEWGTSNEAIYLFQLPSGGAVTSLSLWINGKEEKAVLTTKGKAAAAYKSIVGVQRRDPSWVEWREGNKVAVRVFPVNSKESRVFKIGITAPMSKRGTRWNYIPTSWEGPVKSDTRYLTKIVFAQTAASVEVNNASVTEKNEYQVEDQPANELAVSMEAPEKLNASFAYEGKRYALSNYLPQRSYFDPKDIYLDINSNWSNQEISAMKTLFSGKNIFLFHHDLIKWEPVQGDKIINQLRRLPISCFPFYRIKNREQSLLISKPSVDNISIEDLGESEYATNLKADRDRGSSINCFLLNTHSSGYVRTLIESRYLQPELGSIEDLKELIEQKQFAISEESNERIVIPESGVQIQEDTLPVSNSATDHIYRLFQYNQILRSPAVDSFSIERATKANVVSPVSSLIVLESAQDYKDQGIDTDQKGLGNAGIQSQGAAPEPEEWLLIILFSGTLVYWYFRKKQQITTA